MKMPDRCPECGAVLDEGSSCQTIFDALLVLEFTNPEYGEVHMLTVACFMIQHGRYSDEALTWIERTLRAYLEGGVPPETIRRQAAQETSPGRRAWKVGRQPGAPRLPQIAWSMTIAGVAAQYEDAGSYRDLVKQWAGATLKEMQPLLTGLQNAPPGKQTGARQK
jgi:hypothetical protein